MKRIKKDGMVDAELYSVLITEGSISYSHGFSYAVKEIFIPSIGACLNFENKSNFFSSDERRSDSKDKVKKIKLPKDLVEKIDKTLILKKEVEKEAMEWYELNLKKEVEKIKESQNQWMLVNSTAKGKK